MRLCLFFITLFAFGCKQHHDTLPVCTISPGRSDGEGAYGITVYYDLETANECAASTGRHVLVMFTCYSCMAIGGMQWEILREPEVREIIDDQFVLVVLYIDDKTEIPVTDSSLLIKYGYSNNTIGIQNSILEMENFKQNSQPLYVVVDSNNQAIVPPLGYTKDADEFVSMLENALKTK